MKIDSEREICRSYDEGAEGYAMYWNVPHVFTEADRCNFCNLLPKHGRILDVGCGPGNDSAYFIERGFEVVGIDLSGKMVLIASRRESRAKFEVMDMRSLAFEDNSFDGVWASFSFLHVKQSDGERTLGQFKRVLKNDGYLCLLVHTNETTNYRKTLISGLFDGNGNPMSTYIQEWKKEDLLETLKESDFDVCSVRSFNRAGGLYPLLCVMATVTK